MRFRWSSVPTPGWPASCSGGRLQAAVRLRGRRRPHCGAARRPAARRTGSPCRGACRGAAAAPGRAATHRRRRAGRCCGSSRTKVDLLRVRDRFPGFVRAACGGGFQDARCGQRCPPPSRQPGAAGSPPSSQPASAPTVLRRTRRRRAPRRQQARPAPAQPAMTSVIPAHQAGTTAARATVTGRVTPTWTPSRASRLRGRGNRSPPVPGQRVRPPGGSRLPPGSQPSRRAAAASARPRRR